MAIITSKLNEHVYIELLYHFLILSVENWFDHKIIFQDNATEQKRLKIFFRKGI